MKTAESHDLHPKSLEASKFATFDASPYQLYQPFPPAGDQPQAIHQLVEGIRCGLSFQTLLGVTGSGKTYTMANVIAQLGRPALVFAPNKKPAGAARYDYRGECVGDLRHWQSVRISPHGAHAARGRCHQPARCDCAPDCDAIYAQRDGFSARDVPRARRYDRYFSRRTR